MDAISRKQVIRAALVAAVTGSSLAGLVATAGTPETQDAEYCSATEHRFRTATGYLIILRWARDGRLASATLESPTGGSLGALPDGDYELRSGSRIVQRNSRLTFSSANGPLYCPPNTATDPYCRFEKADAASRVAITTQPTRARLADGTAIIYRVDADVTRVYLESGALLRDGTYTLESRESFTVRGGEVASGTNGVFFCTVAR